MPQDTKEQITIRDVSRLDLTVDRADAAQPITSISGSLARIADSMEQFLEKFAEAAAERDYWRDRYAGSQAKYRKAQAEIRSLKKKLQNK